MADTPKGYNEELAMSQGWILADDSERGLEIQRLDVAERFDSDASALAYVESLAKSDPFSHAAFCLRFIAENRQAWRDAMDAIAAERKKVRIHITRSNAGHYYGSAFEVDENGKNGMRVAKTTVKHPHKEAAAFEISQILTQKGYN